jgi:hypothetical protein
MYFASNHHNTSHKRSSMKKIVCLTAAVSALLFSNCSKSIEPTSGFVDSKSIALAFEIPCDKPGTPVVSKAYVIVSGDSMEPIKQELTAEPCKVYGTITNIPVGSNRHVELKVYDISGSLSYEGEATTNIENGIKTALTIKLRSVSGSINVIGIICDDTVPVPENDPNLLAYYPFEETGGDTVFDASLNGWNGMSYGGKRVAGFSGKGMSFSDSSYAAFDTIIKNGTPEGTVEFYLKLNPNFDTASSMIFFGNDGSRCNVVYTNGRLVFLKNHSNAFKSVSAYVRLIPGNWYHIAGTWGSQGMKLFLNDYPIARNSDTTAYESSPSGHVDWGSEFHIGKKTYCCMEAIGINVGLKFTGSIDEIKLFSVQKY